MCEHVVQMRKLVQYYHIMWMCTYVNIYKCETGTHPHVKLRRFRYYNMYMCELGIISCMCVNFVSYHVYHVCVWISYHIMCMCEFNIISCMCVKSILYHVYVWIQYDIMYVWIRCDIMYMCEFGITSCICVDLVLYSMYSIPCCVDVCTYTCTYGCIFSGPRMRFLFDARAAIFEIRIHIYV